MMKWSVGTKIGAGYGVALAALLIIGVVSYRATTSLIDAAEWRSHTYEALHNLEELSSLLKDAETGQRGYIITRDESYLEPYRTAVGLIDRGSRNLRSLLADNPAQQRKLDALEPLIASKLAELKETIDLRRDQGFEQALQVIRTDRGKKAMDDLRRLIGEVGNTEEDLLKLREAEVQASARNAISFIIFGILCAVVLVAVVCFLVVRNIARPLKEITSAAERMTSGDLSVEVYANGRSDEVGQLSHAFLQMTSYQREMAGTAYRIAEKNLASGIKPRSDKDALGAALSTMAENLRRIMRENREGIHVLISSASEIAASTAQIATGAVETATAVTET
ncbi:MAG TPA: CHASE3 domain-containing protein, partial [Blastocatellia bacterium]|nr:CHASE3 domain-containing protein [Blastocatellia bacterium]